MTQSQDIVIVGGGAIGAACASELARAGRTVLLIDREEDQGDAWRAAAGMLAPQIEAGIDSPMFDFGLAGRERYRELADVLKESTGIDICLWLDGIAHIATTEDEVADLKARVAWQRQQGHVCDWFDAEEAATRWPWLKHATGVLWAPHDGALDPGRLVEALRADAVAHGARMARDSAGSVMTRGNRVIGVRGLSQDHYPAGDVIIAAGAWSPLVEGVPRPLPVAPIRGQMAALPWPAGVEPAIIYGHDCYILARGDEALVGSTMEHAGFNPEVTASGLARIFNSVTALLPALAESDVRRTWAGLRPVTPDGLPIIGPEPGMRGLWYATGHGRNGILLAGVTGVTLNQMLSGEAGEGSMDAFRPERFYEW